MDLIFSMAFIKMSRKLNELYLMTRANKEIPGLPDIHNLSVRENGVCFNQVSARNPSLKVLI